MSSDLDDEHDALRRQVEELQREHDALASRPFSKSEHDRHRTRLREKIAELHAHMARLRKARVDT